MQRSNKPDTPLKNLRESTVSGTHLKILKKTFYMPVNGDKKQILEDNGYQVPDSDYGCRNH